MRDKYEVGVWTIIRKGWNLFNCRVAFEVANGLRVKFQKDTWCPEEPLCVSIPYML